MPSCTSTGTRHRSTPRRSAATGASRETTCSGLRPSSPTLHDWNVIQVPDGMSFQQIVAAQRRARSLANGQPTAIVYRTVKGLAVRHRRARVARGRAQAVRRRLLRRPRAIPQGRAWRPAPVRGGQPPVQGRRGARHHGPVLLGSTRRHQGGPGAIHAAHRGHGLADRSSTQPPGRTSTHAARRPSAGRAGVGSACGAGWHTPGAAPETRLGHNPARRAGPRAGVLQHGERGGPLHRFGRPHGLDEQQPGRGRVSEGFFNARTNPGSRSSRPAGSARTR